MIIAQALENFTLSDFDKIKIIQRKNIDEQGKIFMGDKIECNKKLAEYLLKDNHYKRPFIKIIEYIPDKKPEIKFEEKEIKKPLKKRTSKK